MESTQQFAQIRVVRLEYVHGSVFIFRSLELPVEGNKIPFLLLSSSENAEKLRRGQNFRRNLIESGSTSPQTVEN